MSSSHRANVLVTACLKTPVDPHTKAPRASYERERVLPTAGGHVDNRDYEKELEYDDSGSDFCDEDGPLVMAGCRAAGERFDLSDIFFSNEEYYSKLEELKKAHLRTMAELESMYRRKLQLRSMEPPDLEAGHRLLWSNSPAASRRLRKSHSAVELWRGSRQSDSSDEEDAVSSEVEKGLLSSPKEHIKNMWRDFKVSPPRRPLSSSSLHSLPLGQRRRRRRAKNQQDHGEQEPWKHRVTVPKPFHMTLREAERRRRGVKTRSEMEVENAELRRQLEELTECQRKFHASPAPAHVHLPLYEELQEKKEEERQRRTRQREEAAAAKPFSFLERERLKKERKQLRRPPTPDRDRLRPFKAKPVPKAVYAAASGEQMKEEQLYRSIKIQMRAQEMLCSASMPPSMLARRLSQRKKNTDGGDGGGGGGDGDFPHRPQINREVPDFEASHRRFKRHLEKHKEVKPTTACQPFDLRTSQISSHRDRVLADIQSSPRATRWPHIATSRTPNSSLGSSLSGSLEVLPAKDTDATKKRHEAVRKVLEQRRRAEEEEQRWRERQRQRERKLQRVVSKRAQANDPHLALSETQQAKLKEFRKQELQRRREYQQEVKEMQQRVKGRPLLLEQVAQRNAKQAAEKRYADALLGCDLTEEFVFSQVTKSGSTPPGGGQESDQEEPVRYRKVFLDDEDVEVDPNDTDGGSDDASSDHHHAGGRRSDQSYQYSDDHENYSDESEHDADTRQQEEPQ